MGSICFLKILDLYFQYLMRLQFLKLHLQYQQRRNARLDTFSEPLDSQKKPSDNFRKLFQEEVNKANPRRKLTLEEAKRQNKPASNFRKLRQEPVVEVYLRRNLTAKEAKRLAKLEAIADNLKRGENVQNRQLQTWLSEEQYAQIEAEWDEQPEE